MKRILAAVVTHNRCALLERCIEHLQAQVRPPDAIVVINNGSTDGTEEMLRQRAVRCITQENVGSAGGWHRGIQAALDEGFDAVWLMDDDGYPDGRALAELEARLATGVACVSSVVLRENEPAHFVFPFPMLDGRGFPVLFRLPRKVHTLPRLGELAPGGTYPFAHFFNGALISTAAVRQVGNVNRDYFIYGEEVDYFFRLRKAGAVYSVLSARHYHPDVRQRPYPPAKVYYYIRNTLVVNRLHLDKVALRNATALAAALARITWRNGLADGLSLLAGRRARILYRAIALGLRGRLGKDYFE